MSLTSSLAAEAAPAPSWARSSGVRARTHSWEAMLGRGGHLLRHAPGARDEVDWAREWLWSRAGTIYSGSSEVQRNIIAKRVLELPQEGR